MKPCERRRVDVARARMDLHRDEHGNSPPFYRRLGRLSEYAETLEPTMRASRARQVARTWRVFFGWLIARAIWPSPIWSPG